MLLPALLFGVLAVLVPLDLGSAGWGATAIGAVFLVSAGFEALVSPLLGRFSDRRGRLLPVRISLVALAAVALVLAAVTEPVLLAPLVVLAAISFGGFFAPGMALIADGAEQAGLAQGVAFGLMNAAWAAGNVLGPAAGGGLAQALGDAPAYGLLAAICLATLLASRLVGRARL